MEVSIRSNVRVGGVFVLDTSAADFPSNPKIGSLVLNSEALYAYIKLGTVPDWFPLIRMPERYVHEQTSPSLEWTITHNLNKQDIWYQLQDAEGQLLMPAGFEKVDSNTVKLTFMEAVQGKVLILGSGLDGEQLPQAAVSVTLSSITDWPAGVSAQELGYLNGVTSSIQDQIDALITAVEGVTVTDLAASAITSGVFDVARLGTGTASSATFLRGDGKWETVAAGVGNLPSVSGNAKKFLVTNGETAYWDHQPLFRGTLQIAIGDYTDPAYGTGRAVKIGGGGMAVIGGITSDTFSGNGANITALNADNLSAGSVPNARLGSGTANNSTFLRGDRTWASIIGIPSLSNSANKLLMSDGSSVNWTNSPRIQGTLSLSTGAFSDPQSGVTRALKIGGGGMAVIGGITSDTFSGNGANITALNASNLSTGTVPTARLGTGTADNTKYLRGDGTWATPALTAAGSATQVQFNTGNALTGSSDFTYATATRTLQLAGSSSRGAVLAHADVTSGSLSGGNPDITIKAGGGMSNVAHNGYVRLATSANAGVDLGGVTLGATTPNPAGVPGAVVTGGNFQASATNTYSLGTSDVAWSNIYTQSGTISTSDLRAKNSIVNSDLGLDFVNALRPVSYLMNEGQRIHVPEVRDENDEIITEESTTIVPGTRRHWGLIAQEVKAAIDAAGVDFGGWVLTDLADEDSPQALRYEEFIAPMIKAIQELSARVTALENK